MKKTIIVLVGILLAQISHAESCHDQWAHIADGYLNEAKGIDLYLDANEGRQNMTRERYNELYSEMKTLLRKASIANESSVGNSLNKPTINKYLHNVSIVQETFLYQAMRETLGAFEFWDTFRLEKVNLSK